MFYIRDNNDPSNTIHYELDFGPARMATFMTVLNSLRPLYSIIKNYKSYHIHIRLPDTHEFRLGYAKFRSEFVDYMLVRTRSDIDDEKYEEFTNKCLSMFDKAINVSFVASDMIETPSPQFSAPAAHIDNDVDTDDEYPSGRRKRRRQTTP